MKKILATILALAMVLSLSVSALAEDKTENITINSTSVGTVEVSIADVTDTVYSVTVAWEDTAMEYMKDNGVWNPETHEYVPNEESEERNYWIDAWTTVTVTNHSNAPVTATIAEQDITTGTDYSFSVNSSEGNTFDLETAVDTAADAAPNNTFTITAESAPTTAGTDTFVVTISQYVAPTPEPSYDWYTIAGTDSYFEDEAGMSHDVTTNSFITFSMSSYPNSFDEDPTNDNYETTSVVCSDENVLESVTWQNESGYVFNTTGTYTVTVTFSMEETTIEKAITFNVTE